MKKTIILTLLTLIILISSSIFLASAVSEDYNPCSYADTKTLGAYIQCLLFEDSLIWGTNPNTFDNDGDGLTDDLEVYNYDTDPTNPDTDGDGMNDGDEINWGYDPTNPDQDNDGILDGQDDNFPQGGIIDG